MTISYFQKKHIVLLSCFICFQLTNELLARGVDGKPFGIEKVKFWSDDESDKSDS